MDGTAVVVRLVALVLQLALELHANLDRLKGVGGGDGAAGRYAAGDECAVFRRGRVSMPLFCVVLRCAVIVSLPLCRLS